MKKVLLLLFAVCTLTFISCSGVGEAENGYAAAPQVTISELTPEETVLPSAEPAEIAGTELIDAVKIYSANMWNEFARSYNSERAKYADYITVEIARALDFKDIDFVPLTDGFAGKITAVDSALLPGEQTEQRQEWVKTRKKWPQDYSGTFMNISSVEEVNGEAASSLFGSVGELMLENVSFARIYLDDVECLFAENADALKLYNVRVQNCMLPDAHTIAAVNAGSISVEYFTAESCVLTGYEYMAGLVAFVSGNAEFRDVFICRSSFILSPDNGGSGLWSSGIGLLAKMIDGTACFENIDLYACSTTGLNTQALTSSAGSVSKCSNISLDFCSFVNYKMEGRYPSGIIANCGKESFMEMTVFEENISISNSLISGGYVEEDFTARGYHVENCIFTSDIKEPPQ